ncbi:MAG: hypothetical protein PHV02_07960 [Rhodocyclaceae bacterium]|nr:hypothetical protein [Rhodocyclaceae bacterium]
MNKTKNEAPEKLVPSKGEFGFLKLSTALVASATLILILLGFGVSIAVETKLLIPHGSLYESSTELLDLGSLAIIEILPKMTQNMDQLATFVELMAASLKPVKVILIMYSIFGGIWVLRRFIKRPVSVFDSSSIPWLAKCNSWLATFNLWQDDRKTIGKGFLIILGTVVISVVSPVFLYFALICCLVGLCIVPVIGMVAGMAYIDEVALSNHPCAPLPSIEFHQKRKAAQEANKAGGPQKEPDYAQCLKVVKDGNEVAGRLVLSTSKAVVLYQPSGASKRVPTSDAVIEVVDRLPTQKLAANAAESSLAPPVDNEPATK